MRQHSIALMAALILSALAPSLRAADPADPRARIAALTAAIDDAAATGEARAKALIERGTLHRKLKEADDAVADYGRVVAMADAPVAQQAEALCERALVYSGAQQADKAAADLDRAIEMEGAAPATLIRCLLMRGGSMVAQHQLDKAIADFSRVVDNNAATPMDRASALTQRGQAHDQLKQFDTAIADLNSALELKDIAPYDSVALLYRAVVYGEQNDHPKALADLTALIDGKSTPPPLIDLALMLRGNQLLATGAPDNARADWQRVINSNTAPDRMKEQARGKVAALDKPAGK